MKLLAKILMMSLIALTTINLTACSAFDNDSGMEEVGEDADEAMDDAGDAIDDAFNG